MARSSLLISTYAAVLAGVLLAPPLFAQKATKGGGETKSAPTVQRAEMPDGVALNILIRRTLLTINDANLSGNYSVLRDLAAPDFRSANDTAKLTDIFAPLRKSKIDMAPILYFDPKLVRKPEFTKSGMLRLSGFVETRPQQINFDMLFQKVSGHWRLFGVAVNTTPAKAAAAAPNGAGSAKTNAKKSP